MSKPYKVAHRLYEFETHCPACYDELLVVSEQPIEVTALHFCSDCRREARRLQKPGVNKRAIFSGLIACSVFWGALAWWWLR